MTEAHEDSPGNASRPSARRLWLFRLLALVVIPALLLLLLELALRLIGFGYPTSFARKTRLNGQTVYVRNTDFARRFFPEGLGRAPLPFEIPAIKPPNTWRIFILGASAARGTPEPSFGFGRILEVQLRERYPDVNFELVNCAATAINSHVVVEIARDCAELDPDIFVVYLGNNEVVGPFGAGTVLTRFSPSLAAIRAGLRLRTTRIGQLLGSLLASAAGPSRPRRWEGMRMFLGNQVPADDPALGTVYDHFRQNLADICRVGERSDIPVVFCTVATNLRDCPPLASQHRSDLTDEQAAEWETIYEQGVVLETRGDYAGAVERYVAALAIDDRYADLHYRLGRCRWALEEYEKARERFLDARRLDTLRFRADAPLNDIIRRVAGEWTERGVSLVDVAKTFEENSPHATPGEEFFHEHVHMNFRGNHLLATSVLRQLERVVPEWIRQKGPAGGAPAATEAECAARLAYTAWDRYRITTQVLNSYIKEPPFTNQLYHDQFVATLERRLNELDISDEPAVLRAVDAQYGRAIERNPADHWLHYNYAGFLLSASWDEIAIARQLEYCLRSLPDDASLFDKLGRALSRRGRYDKAERFFRKALQIAPDNPRVRTDLADALARAGKLSEAFEQYDIAIRLDPEEPATYVSRGAACRLYDRVDEAIENFRRALVIEPDFAAAHSGLAAILSAQGKLDEAAEHLRQVLSVSPNDGDTHHSLGIILQAQRRFAEAIRHFRAALETDADEPETHRRLGLTLAETGQTRAALARLRTAVRLKPDWSVPMADLAWILATCRDPAVRNGAEAVEWAERACPGGTSANPRFLDSLAAAYAEVGRFSDAVATAREALARTPPENMRGLGERKRRLELYETGEPYHPPRRVRP